MMNSLSSLPPPAFAADLGLRGAAASALAPAGAPDQARTASFPALDDGAAAGSLLHVGPAGGLASLDDIERSFVAALCETAPA